MYTQRSVYVRWRLRDTWRSRSSAFLNSKRLCTLFSQVLFQTSDFPTWVQIKTRRIAFWTVTETPEGRGVYVWEVTMYSTVGCRRTGVDGPSLDRSYFSRLQPISFLFFDPSSSHIAYSAYTVLDINVASAHNARRAGEAAEIFWPVDVESFRSQQCRWRSRLHSKRCLRVAKTFLTQFSSLAVLRQTVLRHPTVLYGLTTHETRLSCRSTVAYFSSKVLSETSNAPTWI